MNAQQEKIIEVLKGTSFEEWTEDVKELETADEVIEYLEERITETEVIYYSNAMEYLSENDASLNDSIGIAVELGYSLKNVNSELLATLLQQQNLNEELSKIRDDIENSFNEE